MSITCGKKKIKYPILHMKYSFLTIMYERDIKIHTVVTSDGAGKVTYHEKSLCKYCKYYFITRNTYILACSGMTVVHDHVNIFV